MRTAQSNAPAISDLASHNRPASNRPLAFLSRRRGLKSNGTEMYAKENLAPLTV